MKNRLAEFSKWARGTNSSAEARLGTPGLTSCANVHNALMDLVHSHSTTKEAHVDLRKSRKKSILRTHNFFAPG